MPDPTINENGPVNVSTAARGRVSGKSRLESVSELDRKILALLGKRARLTAELNAEEKGRRRSTKSLTQERQLWSVWEEDAARFGHNPLLWRKLFNLMQGISVREPNEATEKNSGFVLNPRPRIVEMRVACPPDLEMSRMWLMLAAGAAESGRVCGVVQNDTLRELIKGLNHMGASLSSDQQGLAWKGLGSAGGQGDNSIHVGNDPFNLILLLCRNLGRPCRLKFAGGAALKIDDFGELMRLFPILGARLVSLAPHGRGTPLRLESSGELPEVLEAEKLSEKLLAALLLAAPFFSAPMVFAGLKHDGAPYLVGKAIHALEDWGLDPEQSPEGLIVRPGRPLRSPVLPPDMDPFLTPYLAALILGPGGRIELEGHWPKERKGPGIMALAMLKTCGITFNRTSRRLMAVCGPAPTGDIVLKVGPWSPYFPLALFLAGYVLERNKNISTVKMEVPEDHILLSETQEFLERIFCQAEQIREGLLVSRQEGERDPCARPWVSPGPYWAAALALSSLVRGGLALANPGIVTALYPDFWALYNGLSKKIDRVAAGEVREKEEQEAALLKRRIIV